MHWRLLLLLLGGGMLLPAALAATPPGEDPENHPLGTPAEAALSESHLAEAERTLRLEVSRGGFPGATLAVGREDLVVLERGLGQESWGGRPTDPHRSLYDLASLTKVVATTTAAMLLYEDGRIELDAPVQRYLPAFQGPGKERVTLRHLLTHTSGLPVGATLRSLSPESAWEEVLALPLKGVPGSGPRYSDIGFIVLAEALEEAAGEPLDSLLARRVFRPLQMTETRFYPGGSSCLRCVPSQRLPDGSLRQGEVHDPLARRLGGAAGNAGLFSTAHDLGRFAAMLASGGLLEGHRVLKSETVRVFRARQPGAGTRALGWDTRDPKGEGASGLALSPTAYGHTGFTGTSLWIDPERRTWVVLLANRTLEPRAGNRIQLVRRSVHAAVCRAADVEFYIPRPQLERPRLTFRLPSLEPRLTPLRSTE